MEDLSKIKHLKRCILESLRLTPTVPACVRQMETPFLNLCEPQTRSWNSYCYNSLGYSLKLTQILIGLILTAFYQKVHVVDIRAHLYSFFGSKKLHWLEDGNNGNKSYNGSYVTIAWFENY